MAMVWWSAQNTTARGTDPALMLRCTEHCQKEGFNRVLPRIITTFLALGLCAGAVSGQPQPRTIFKERVKLSESEIQKIEQGQVFTKVLGSSDKYGMLVFGAVYVNAPVEKFAAAFRDVQKLKQNKVYLDVQEFSPGGAQPKLSDFERLALDKKDI